MRLQPARRWCLRCRDRRVRVRSRQPHPGRSLRGKMPAPVTVQPSSHICSCIWQQCTSGHWGNALNGGSCSSCSCNGLSQTCHPTTGICSVIPDCSTLKLSPALLVLATRAARAIRTETTGERALGPSRASVCGVLLTPCVLSVSASSELCLAGFWHDSLSAACKRKPVALPCLLPGTHLRFLHRQPARAAVFRRRAIPTPASARHA